MARIRSTLALSLGMLTCFAQLAAAQPSKDKGKAKGASKDAKPKGGATKPIDLDAPLPGDEPAAPAAGAAGAAKGSSDAAAGGGSGSAGATVEMTDDDKPSEDPTGTRENPNAPHVGGDDETTEVRAGAPPPRRTGYPIEEALRPITLPQNTSEVALDLRTFVDHADAEAALRARYGITRQVQIGLQYDIGGVFKDTTPMAKTKFNTGKAAAVEGTYLVQEWVGVHVQVPIYMQPFAMGVTLGAPMKFHLGDRVALFGLDNIVDITLHKFAPSLINEASNRTQAALIESNTVKNDGNLRFIGGAVYQLDQKTALLGSLGLVIPNFSGSAIYPLEGVLQWSPSSKIDLAGRLGFDSLADAKSSFGIRFTAAFRI